MVPEIRKELEEAVWENKLNQSTVQILAAIECLGGPNNPGLQIKILERLRECREGDYPVTFKGLKQFCPELFG